MSAGTDNDCQFSIKFDVIPKIFLYRGKINTRNTAKIRPNVLAQKKLKPFSNIDGCGFSGFTGGMIFFDIFKTNGFKICEFFELDAEHKKKFYKITDPSINFPTEKN